MRNPGIGTVLHWRHPDVHIFHTDPSLVIMLLNKKQSDSCHGIVVLSFRLKSRHRKCIYYTIDSHNIFIQIEYVWKSHRIS